MVLKTIHDWALLLIPSIVCYSASAGCRIGGDAGVEVSFRPPSWLFGVVWGCLFICLGLSWVFSTKNEANLTDIPPKNNILIYVIYSLIILSLMFWIITYGCFSKFNLKNAKKGAVWLFIPIIMFCIMGLSLGNKISRLLLAPLLAWVIFAMFLSTFEYQLTYS